MPYPFSRIEILKEIKETNKAIKQNNNYRTIKFLKIHKAKLQKALEKLIA